MITKTIKEKIGRYIAPGLIKTGGVNVKERGVEDNEYNNVYYNRKKDTYFIQKSGHYYGSFRTEADALDASKYLQSNDWSLKKWHRNKKRFKVINKDDYYKYNPDMSCRYFKKQHSRSPLFITNNELLEIIDLHKMNYAPREILDTINWYHGDKVSQYTVKNVIRKWGAGEFNKAIVYIYHNPLLSFDGSLQDYLK